jgi:hypothetical protein
MRIRIYVCSHCHRLLTADDTQMIGAGMIGNLRVPKRHLNADKETCSGSRAWAVHRLVMVRRGRSGCRADADRQASAAEPWPLVARSMGRDPSDLRNARSF